VLPGAIPTGLVAHSVPHRMARNRLPVAGVGSGSGLGAALGLALAVSFLASSRGAIASCTARLAAASTSRRRTGSAGSSSGGDESLPAKPIPSRAAESSSRMSERRWSSPVDSVTSSSGVSASVVGRLRLGCRHSIYPSKGH